jgi:group II intron reverse transcriptase/maturase
LHIIDIPLLKTTFSQLKGNTAVGVDGMTKENYGQHVEENLNDLLTRIRRGTYRPKPARVVDIPQEDGSTRPLAISCWEDKLVQRAVNEILTSIYEPLFLPTSFGFRPGKNCHQALKALNHAVYRYYDGAVVEIDLRQCFDTIPHQGLLDCLKKKISDKRLIKLVGCLLKTPKLTDQGVVANEIGCPQGSILSPLLANIYLHDVIDTWFDTITREHHIKGSAELVRYCDDMVFIFQTRRDAERFYQVLPKRLAKYGLTLNTAKSQVIRSGMNAMKEAQAEGKRLATYHFLGFTCYWGKSRKGYWRLKFTSRRDRFTNKLKGLRRYLRENLNTPDTWGVLQTVARVVRGWINYHGISDNHRRVSAFIEYSKRLVYHWFNRRGSQRSMTWSRLKRLLQRLPFPRTWKTVTMF